MRPHPKRARTNPNSPRAWAVSDRTSFISNHERLVWQHEWAGSGLINKHWLVEADKVDRPQRQLGTLFIPADPPPIIQARPQQIAIDEEPVSSRITPQGQIRVVRYKPYPVIRIVAVRGQLPNPY